MWRSFALPITYRSSYRKNSSLRQFLQARADERGGLGRRSELSGNPGHGGGGLRLAVAEANEGEDRVLGGLGELRRALETRFRMDEIGDATAPAPCP